MKSELEQLKKEKLAPNWMTEEGYATISKGYLLKNETPRDAYERCAKSSSVYLKKPELKKIFFDLMWEGYLGPSSPIFSNSGTDRGLTISCFGFNVPDSTHGIFEKVHELAMLSKNGGGVSSYLGNIRGRGALIKGGANGVSEGVVPWIKVMDSTTLAVSQGGVRRGASAMYLPIHHKDIEEFLRIRRPEGDINRQCHNTHHGVVIDDKFMNSLYGENGQKVVKSNRALWGEILKTRVETGEPYIMFYDNCNKSRPKWYIDQNKYVDFSNICTEINLYSDFDHSFVCCLSSLNLFKWDEWKDKRAAYWSIWFLDGIMQEFIEKSDGIPGLECARRFAVKSRALGLGVLGFHSYLQEKMLPFEGLQSKLLNRMMFKHIRSEADEATKDLAKEYGSPEWLQGYGVRNSHLLAPAPTVTNSTILGALSPSIEPWSANAFTQKTAKGTFIRRNSKLESVLASFGKNTPEIWKSIVSNHGSIQHLDFPDEVKKVFLTAREINQHAIIDLAADRQEYIDQSQSINLFFPANSSSQYIHDVHYKAWVRGIKTLYYFRSESVINGDAGLKEYVRYSTECVSCEG
jgi:ribonucleoside-diphosphate reductase alpha chain